MLVEYNWSFNQLSICSYQIYDPQDKSTIMKNLQITLVFCLVTIMAFGQVSTSEKQALIALFESTNGTEWIHSWDLEAPVSSWYGVEVTEDKVTGIDLSFNNLNGALPHQLTELKHLQNLNLFRNSISGELPSSMGSLTNLRTLNIGFNKLSGTIPESIGELKNLTSLQLFMNSLKGEIPVSIGNLKELRSIQLFNRHLMRFYQQKAIQRSMR